MKQKMMLAGLGSLVCLSLACGQKPLSTVGRLSLDPAASKLSAVSLKNESKEVALNFPGLSGWAEASGKAELDIAVDKLMTGDEARDANLKTYFFELAKDAGFAKAHFTLGKVDADLDAMKAGQPLSTKGQGMLSLHGAGILLSGPLTFTRKGKTVSVTLEDGWQILIDQTNFVAPLKALNKNCPQPHRVGNAVKLKGTLVFKAA